MTRSMLCIAALLCALAAPSAALAQGAGDEQYEDPFGDEQSQQADPTPEPTATPAPVQRAPSAPAPTPAPAAAPSSAQAPTQAAPSDELPRTGLGAGWVALAGAVLLAAGLALRRADLQR
jgi:LPXTG-motif cell wall-anchored protein